MDVEVKGHPSLSHAPIPATVAGRTQHATVPHATRHHIFLHTWQIPTCIAPVAARSSSEFAARAANLQKVCQVQGRSDMKEQGKG